MAQLVFKDAQHEARLLLRPVRTCLHYLLAGSHEMKLRSMPLILPAVLLITACSPMLEMVQDTITEPSSVEATAIAAVNEVIDRMQIRIITEDAV